MITSKYFVNCGEQILPTLPTQFQYISVHTLIINKRSHFLWVWPLLAFNSLYWPFWPLMSFLSQRISFWVKIKCKWTLSTDQMLKTVFEPYGSTWFTVIRVVLMLEAALLVLEFVVHVRYQFQYTANFYPMKTTGLGIAGSLQRTCTIYGKGL